MKTARFFTLIILSLCLLCPQMLSAQGRRDNTARDSLRREMRRTARLRAREVEPVRIDSALLEGNMRMVGTDGRIALSLEGGGARGLYHIGVIKALEENDIPIDYISGTSMGAIIAALYAAGYSPEEIEAVATSGQVEEWVSGKIDERYKFFYNERENTPSMFSIYADVESDTLRSRSLLNLALPHSFINTAQIDMALIELLSPASAAAGGDFDRLMIPFRAVASDMNLHEAVVYSRGDLPFVVRASMSYPLLFRPVTDDKGRVLVDGGVYNNFPWQPLEEDFKPDFHIGSLCLDGREAATQESSVEKQVMALVTMPSDYNMPEGRSMIIKRKITSSLLDFSGGGQTIEHGYNDAMAAMPYLKERVKARRTAQEVAARRERFRNSQPPLRFGRMDIEGLNPRQQEYAHSFMNFEKYDPASSKARPANSFEDVRERYFSLMATEEFSSDAFPTVRYDSLLRDFSIGLKLSTKPGMRFRLGGNISSTAFNQAFINFTYFSLGRTATTSYADLFIGPVSSVIRVGGRTVFIGRTPKYLDYSVQGSWQSSMRGSFGNVTPARNTIDARTTETFAHLGFGLATTRHSTLDLSVNAGYTFYSYVDSYDEPDNPSTHDKFRFAAARLQFQHSTLDKIEYPTRGGRFSASIIGVHGRDRYENAHSHERYTWLQSQRSWVGAKLKWEHYPSNWKDWWFSVGYNIEAVYTNHPDFGNPYATILTSPRFAPTPHSRMLYMPEFYAHRYAAAGVMPTFRLRPNFFLRAGIYAMLRDPLVADEYMHYMSDLSFVYHTRIGPVSLSLTKYNFDTKNNFYVMANFGYPIFAQRGLFY
ncbi:MAG: patatin-like phospholipase family protein [Alistipes sp.]|nr:patatin-like phospholipase family protein [Alistipes sp.]